MGGPRPLRFGRRSAAPVFNRAQQLRVLEEKGHVRHEEEAALFYLPTVARKAASRSALNHLADTFFDGSHAGVITALLGPDGLQLSDEELDRIARLIDETRKASR